MKIRNNIQPLFFLCRSLINKKNINCLILMLFFLTCNAQNISVSSLKLLESDLTANTAGTMETDQNGETAALIKVVTTQTGFSFDGGALGIVKTVQKPSEIWVYVPRGLKKITISHPQLGILRDYYLNIPIEAARTYEMILVAGEVQTIVKQARTSQYVVFQLTPPDAVVELDGELLHTTDGIASKMMKFGTYDYRIQAPDYISEAGKVTIDDPNNKKIVSISLKPNFSEVTVVVDNNAEIWINGDKKGNGTWTGNLGKGTYEFEAKLQGYRSTLITKDIIVSKASQTITLQAPIPIYGEADINSNPSMADIFIDGKKVGQTPEIISNLLIGKHNLRICKNGFEDFDSTIIINESASLVLNLNLPKTGDGQVFTINGVNFKMIHVKGGTFRMGETNIKHPHSLLNQIPAHNVTLSDYYIGETEVTQELWIAVMGKNPSQFRDDKNPVESISWDDCQLFLKKLKKLTKNDFRLPTEAEWEFAAQGGNLSHGYLYSGDDEIKNVAWYSNTTERSTCHVKMKQSNELGIYDMSGNVQEWCQDWHDQYTTKNQKNPKGPTKGRHRVFRGGGWNLYDIFCTVTERSHSEPNTKRNNIGLRLVMDAK